MKQEQPDPLLRLHSAAIGAPKRAKPVTGPQPTHPMCVAMGRAYWAVEDVRMATMLPEPAEAAELPAGSLAALAGMVATPVATKPQPDADGWIPFVCTAISVCPVPEGVEFEARIRDGRVMKGVAPWLDWSLLYAGGSAGDIVAYRILPAKSAALPGWRKGPDVPVAERQSGLWFVRQPNGAIHVWQASSLKFVPECEYRPAPPGVKDGDAYDAKLYGEEA
jgi:hypothetical protein